MRGGGPAYHGFHSALRREARRHRNDPWWIWREMGIWVYLLGIGLKHALKWLLVMGAVGLAWQLWFITVPLLAVAVGIWLGKGKPPVADWRKLREPRPAAWGPPPPPPVRTVANWDPVARGLAWVAISLVVVAFIGMAVVTATGGWEAPSTSTTTPATSVTPTTVEAPADVLFDIGQAKGNLLAAYGLLTPERCEAEYQTDSGIWLQPPGVQDRMRNREQPSWMAGCLAGTAAGFEQDLWSQKTTTTTQRGP